LDNEIPKRNILQKGIDQMDVSNMQSYRKEWRLNMISISMSNSLKTTLSLILGCCFACSTSQKEDISFEYSVIDDSAIGHRKVADIDRDGFNDIIAVNHTESENLLVWYKYPDWKKYKITNIGAFSDYENYRSCDMEVADVDGDGDSDLVGRIGKTKDDIQGINCWFENPGSISELEKGSWKRYDIGESQYAKDIEVVDLNGDGKLDVVSRALNAKLHIYFQKNPTDWKEIVIDITHHDGMDVGDVDRDGDPDVVLNGYWIETPAHPFTDDWHKYDFDDKWYTQKTGDDGKWYDNNTKVELADMNEDGCLDVVIAQSENAGFPVSWYEAPPDPKNGNWKEHVIGQIDYCHSLNVVDFDNDGDLDVMAGELEHSIDPNPEGPHPVLIFINQGHALQWKTQQLTSKGNYSAAIGDIGNDGDIDIVGLRRYNTPPIEMWENKTSDNKLSLDNWAYIQVDSTRQLCGK